MYKNVIDPGKSVSFVLKDIDIGGQIQYLMCTGPLHSLVIKGHKRLQKVTRGKKLKTSHRDQIFCRYTQISIKNYIMHESLFLEVIGGHIRSQTVRKRFSLVV